MQHVRCGIGDLLLAQCFGGPVGALLLLRKLNAYELGAEILEAVPVGIGAAEFRRDLGAVDRIWHDAEIVGQDGKVETGEMEQLFNGWVNIIPFRFVAYFFKCLFRKTIQTQDETAER